MKLLVLVGVAGLCFAQEASDFAGTWVMRVGTQPVMKLTLTARDGVLGGRLTRPENMTVTDGEITTIDAKQVNQPVEKAAVEGGRLTLTIDGDPYIVKLEGSNRLAVSLAGTRPLIFDRALDGQPIVLTTRLPARDFPPEIRALRDQLHRMVAEEQDARLKFDEARYEAIDEKNRPEVLRIFERYGWVTKSLAGSDAAHDYWLLVQHQTPEIQRRLLPALEKAAKAGEASMSDYAYLYDRVQMGLRKPQRWGTQVDCKDGKPVLYTVEDPAGLDSRREKLFLPPVAEYLAVEYLVKFCAAK